MKCNERTVVEGPLAAVEAGTAAAERRLCYCFSVRVWNVITSLQTIFKRSSLLKACAECS